MKKINFALLMMLIVFLSSCTQIRPVFFMTPSDFVILPVVYVVLSFVMALILSIGGNRNDLKKYFWQTMLTTPVVGFIRIIIRLLS